MAGLPTVGPLDMGVQREEWADASCEQRLSLFDGRDTANLFGSRRRGPERPSCYEDDHSGCQGTRQRGRDRLGDRLGDRDIVDVDPEGPGSVSGPSFL